MRESKRLGAVAQAEEDARDAFRDRLEELSAEVVGKFEDFAAWRAKCEREWSFHPELYSEPDHMALRDIGSTWFQIHSRMVKLIDRIESGGVSMSAKAAEIRKRYSGMLGVELMDSGPMPQHIQDLAHKAIKEYSAA